MKRSNLIAARIQAGFNSQQDFIKALQNNGFDISIHEYGNIESGRKKEVGVGIALVIAKVLKKTKEIESLFLPLPTYKLRRYNKDHPSAAQPTDGPKPAA